MTPDTNPTIPTPIQPTPATPPIPVPTVAAVPSLPALPAKMPTSPAMRDAAILASLTAVKDSTPSAASALLSVMSDGAKQDYWNGIRQQAVANRLAGMTGLVGTKVRGTRINIGNKPGAWQFAGVVDPNGHATITGYDGMGNVRIEVKHTLTVSADSITGLLQ